MVACFLAAGINGRESYPERLMYSFLAWWL